MTLSSLADWPRPRKIAILALSYFVLAAASRLLAIPPGYATIVWPPAGLALGALLLWGSEAWPGVLIGSFLGNLWSPSGPPPSASLHLAAWIAAGATLQSLAAAALTRRATAGRDPLSEENDLFCFLFCGGILASVVSASWALLGMRLLDVIAPSESAFTWTTWWIGDAIGVAAVAPMFLLWSGRGPASLRRARAAVSASLAATVLAVAAVHIYSVRNEEEVQRSHARQKLADISLTLRIGLAGHLDALQTASDIFASEDVLTRAEFSQFARGILARHPGMQALEWRPRVTRDQRAAVEQAARREGLKDFMFKGIAPDGTLVRRPEAPEYFPILYAEPVKGNERAFGLDIGQQQNPALDAAERALASGRPAASAGVRLVQETGDQTSVLVMVPVRSARKEGPVGLIEGVYRVGDMMESMLAGVDENVLTVRLYDETPPGPPQLLYSRGAQPRRAHEPLTMHGDFAGRHWTVALLPRAAFQERNRPPLSWYVVFTALLFVYLVSWVTLTLYGSAERVAAQVQGKTEELREQERRLLRAQKLESVGRLAGGIAHEFNNILMGASGLAQLALQTLGPDHPSSGDLEGIVASVKHAGHLVSQLLTYSRHKEAVKRAVDLNELVSHLSKMIQAAVGRRVHVEISLPSEPSWIMADAGQVEQVLLNLCFNARDAVKGRGRIRIAVRPTTLGRRLDSALLPAEPGNYATLEVADDGSGIPSDVLARMFEPFFTTKPFGEGTGLGLSVVSGIVRQHGGGLDVRTSPETGTAMLVHWPATTAPAPQATPAPTVTVPHGSGLILVVDDEPVVRSLIERVLARCGYRTAGAASGKEALELFARTPSVRAVVLDVVMPELDGLETYDRLREIRPDLKVLFLSGFAPERTERELARRGLPFLAKPADPDRLALALFELLEAPGSSPA